MSVQVIILIIIVDVKLCTRHCFCIGHHTDAFRLRISSSDDIKQYWQHSSIQRISKC